MTRVDRLLRIKVDHLFGPVNRYDVAWLIAELERLRAEARKEQRGV
jgi:hypothetical protein